MKHTHSGNKLNLYLWYICKDLTIIHEPYTKSDFFSILIMQNHLKLLKCHKIYPKTTKLMNFTLKKKVPNHQDEPIIMQY